MESYNSVGSMFDGISNTSTDMSQSGRRCSLTLVSKTKLKLVGLISIIVVDQFFLYYFMSKAIDIVYNSTNNSVCNPFADANGTNTIQITERQFYSIFHICFVLSIFGGLLGDGIIGRSRTSILGLACYLLSICILSTYFIEVGDTYMTELLFQCR